MTYKHLGRAPSGEKAVPLGHDDYERLATCEAQRYRQLLRDHFGPEPPGCEYRVFTDHAEPWDQISVIISYDQKVPGAEAYAELVERQAPRTWNGYVSKK
jgi:hypothetical protein